MKLSRITTFDFVRMSRTSNNMNGITLFSKFWHFASFYPFVMFFAIFPFNSGTHNIIIIVRIWIHVIKHRTTRAYISHVLLLWRVISHREEHATTDRMNGEKWKENDEGKITSIRKKKEKENKKENEQNFVCVPLPSLYNKIKRFCHILLTY